ncbi:hypothetical protein BJY16_009266 [Actinoplanes octamycinicus]|uniref:Ig-like domain repeat protein n=1 Tax=Actinoplanes octamycinicus TaxID=135948 RepID=A0A7W7H912_9ACTN|nr:hypothetical protein [Actinoplanes octamycinicus]MBB4745807.1 hypothetical protein [Actinoplanes octamycinicus]GIE63609.1 hypothetical protein Aoc01nite_90110 [Actinoplanes octamycinicus]
MRKRTIRAMLAAGVLVAGSAVFADLATGTASAATAPTTLTEQQRHAITGYHADRMVVDSSRERLLIADDVAHEILAVGYDGGVLTRVALPDGANATDLQLSADSGRLWATLPAARLIVSWDAATLAEVRRYPVEVPDLGHLALGGGKVWFTYFKNYFASLDVDSGDVVRHQLGDGNDASASSQQPLIAVNPADPSQLALTYAGTRKTLFLYDTDSDLTAPVTKTDTGEVSAHSSLKYTADGTMIYVAGNGGVYYTWANDLTSISARTIAMTKAADVEVASDDWVAAGLPVTADATDLRLFPAAETVATREFDIPFTGDAPELVDLAWGAGSARLFAITADQSLWVLDQPTNAPATSAPAQAATAIKLTAPASAAVGSGINVQGTISGGVPMGAELKVTRTDAASPAGVALQSAGVNGSGGFSFIDFPTALGTVTYTVAYAGDATHKPSSATVSVQSTKTVPQLTLNRNGSVNAYGATVVMTAHLGPTAENRTVEIWADPYGTDRPRTLLKKGTVDGSGNLSVSYQLTRNTSVSAVFTGDTEYGARTVTSAVYTKAAVSTTVAKHYSVKNSYYYVRKTKNPTFTTTMTPYPGRYQRLTFEKYSGGKWVAWKSGSFKLSSAGKYTYTLTGTHTTGVKYRVAAAYLYGTSGDKANYTTYGSWKYFTFTK